MDGRNGEYGNGNDENPASYKQEGVEAQPFWGDDESLAEFQVSVHPPSKPLAILEKLGSSPFERGQFPFIGFLATTYEKVSQFALERAGNQRPDAATDN